MERKKKIKNNHHDICRVCKAGNTSQGRTYQHNGDEKTLQKQTWETRGRRKGYPCHASKQEKDLPRNKRAKVSSLSKLAEELDLSTDEDLDDDEEGGGQVDAGMETGSEDQQPEEEPEDKRVVEARPEDQRVVEEIEDEVVISLRRNRNQISRTRLVSITVVTETYLDMGNGLPKRGTVKTKTAYFDN